MCDYSLEQVQSRPAKVGDQLTSTTFGNAITRGFAAIGNPDVAVCLAPGTELSFDNDVECEHPLGSFPVENLGEKTARFRQINFDRKYEHHDALEFPSGRIVLLTRLRPGQHASVLQLPIASSPVDATLPPPREPLSVQPSLGENLVLYP